ncbi:unnamed protein product [Agarophyton chilense]
MSSSSAGGSGRQVGRTTNNPSSEYPQEKTGSERARVCPHCKEEWFEGGTDREFEDHKKVCLLVVAMQAVKNSGKYKGRKYKN